MRSRLGYVLPFLIIAVGLAAFLTPLLSRNAQMDGRIASFQRVRIPGTAAVDLPAGPITVFYEKRSILNGERLATAMTFPPTQLRLTAPDGAPVELTTSTQTVIYNRPPYHAHSVAYGTLPAAGTYTLEAEPAPAPAAADAQPEEVAEAAGPTLDEQPRVLALGQLPVTNLLKGGLTGIYGGAVVLGIAFTAATVLFLVTYVRRNPATRDPRGPAPSQARGL